MLFNDHCGIRIDIFKGFKNEDHVIIGKIAVLDEWREESKGQGKLSMVQLVSRITRNENELKTVD
jgi:hypothetical protein